MCGTESKCSGETHCWEPTNSTSEALAIPTFATCRIDCIEITVTSGDRTDKISWVIYKESGRDQPGEETCRNSKIYGNHSTEIETCCLTTYREFLYCQDSGSNGWGGGYITINGVQYCNKSTWDDNKSGKTYQLDLEGTQCGDRKTAVSCSACTAKHGSSYCRDDCIWIWKAVNGEEKWQCSLKNCPHITYSRIFSPNLKQDIEVQMDIILYGFWDGKQVLMMEEQTLVFKDVNNLSKDITLHTSLDNNLTTIFRQNITGS